ncbi:A24 family peptidase C-terminal domain-containing protein [Sulfolobus tengchongensis]|uniref:A24 family peptidase C-terminal domain-containing protein n=1 Tax=Sulfolobus tengchongensis TaxID=207809 RepID=A0AAX4L3M7_9CREN
MLVHTSILDIKYREVDPKIWIYYSFLSLFIIANIHYLFLPIYIYSFIITNVLFFILYKLSLMGGADLFLNLILSLANASVFPLIPSNFSVIGLEPLIIVLYSSIIILIFSMLNFVKYYRYVKNLPFSKRIIFALSARRVKIKDFINSKFLFPLTEIREDGSVILREYFSVEEDDKYWREYYAKLVREGKISEETYIWVTWGIPVIPFMLAGYVLSLIIGFPF